MSHLAAKVNRKSNRNDTFTSGITLKLTPVFCGMHVVPEKAKRYRQMDGQTDRDKVISMLRFAAMAPQKIVTLRVIFSGIANHFAIKILKMTI